MIQYHVEHHEIDWSKRSFSLSSNLQKRKKLVEFWLSVLIMIDFHRYGSELKAKSLEQGSDLLSARFAVQWKIEKKYA